MFGFETLGLGLQRYYRPNFPDISVNLKSLVQVVNTVQRILPLVVFQCNYFVFTFTFMNK